MIIHFIKDFFVTLTILVSFITLFSILTKESQLNKSSTIAFKFLTGILGGIVGVILMDFDNHGSFLIDFRHIPIILLAYYGGITPSLISTVTVILGSYLIEKNSLTIEDILILTLILIMSVFVSNKNFSHNSKVLLTLSLSNLILVSIATFYIKEFNQFLPLISLHVIFTYIAGHVSFFLMEYFNKSQDLLNRYKLESTIDSLTGLNNVRNFENTFKVLMKNAIAKNESLTLLYIDIDFFKNINDLYGHKEGDMVLRTIGEILKKSTRPLDIVSRNGGEEFTVMLLNCSGKLSYDISERIRKAIENHIFILSSGDKIKVTVSIGLATFNSTDNDETSLLEKADKALYQAKRMGRNQVVYDFEN